MGIGDVLILIKVLFLIPTLDRGGAENVLVNLVNHMDCNSFDITVQTLFDKESQKDILNPNIRYKSFLYKQFRGNSRIIAALPSKLLYKLIVKDEYDIVVSYLEGPTAHILSGCPFKSTKKVAWIHTAFDSEKGFAAGFRSKNAAIKEYKKYDMIAFVAKTAMDRFVEIARAQLPKCKVIYNTIDSSGILNQVNESIEPEMYSKNSINVISVGKIVPVKGYDRLVRVHKRLIKEGILHHIYILGTGKQQQELEDYIQKNQLTETFKFVGFRNNPYKYMSHADLFVCSSRREGFSTAITEALIVGLPVVSTDCSGTRELLGDNNEYGIVTDNTEDGLYKGMKKILTDNDLLIDYKAKAIERGKTFSTEKTVASVDNALRDLLLQ